MAAKYTAEPNDFFDRKVKTATVLVKCHPSNLTTGIGSQSAGRNQVFACTTLEGEKEKLFLAYAQKSSRLCKELVKCQMEKASEGELVCYITIEKLTIDLMFVDGAANHIDGCWIKEFLLKDKYDGFDASKKTASSVLNNFTTSVSIAMFKADRTAKPVKYFAKAKLDDYYNYDFSRCVKSHWSVHLSCRDSKGSTDAFHGYAVKNGEIGETVRKILEDGREHDVEVVLAHPNNAQSSDHCDISYIAVSSATEKKTPANEKKQGE